MYSDLTETNLFISLTFNKGELSVCTGTVFFKGIVYSIDGQIEREDKKQQIERLKECLKYLSIHPTINLSKQIDITDQLPA